MPVISNPFLVGTHNAEAIWTSEPANGVVTSIFKGEAMFATGERGEYAGVEAIANDGSFWGTHVIVLNDGSVSRQSFEGEVTLKTSDTHLSGIGIWKFIDGTGQCAALNGGGAFRWQVDGLKYYAEFTA